MYVSINGYKFNQEKNVKIMKRRNTKNPRGFSVSMGIQVNF